MGRNLFALTTDTICRTAAPQPAGLLCMVHKYTKYQKTPVLECQGTLASPAVCPLPFGPFGP